MDPMAVIRQTFFEECEEQLSEMESGLLAMNDGGSDSETVNAVFRAVHSIKGGAGAFKLNALVSFAHVFETVLDNIRSGRLDPDFEVMRIMLRAADVLADLVRMSRTVSDIDPSNWKPLAQELELLASRSSSAQVSEAEALPEFEVTTISFDGAEAASSAPEARMFEIAFRPQPGLFAKANEPAVLLRELGKLGDLETRCDTSSVPSLDTLNATEPHLSWSMRLTTNAEADAISEIFEFVEGDCTLEVSTSAQPAATSNTGSGEPPSVGQDIDSVLQGLLASVRASEAPEAQAAIAAPAASPGSEPADNPGAGLLANQATKIDEEVREAAPLSAPPPNGPGATSKSTIRVDLDRVDRLINLVGELVINQAMLSQRVVAEGFATSSLVMIGLDELEQLTREIQESVMAIRAQPVKPLFQRMSRIVREVCEATGKDVRLRTDGESTEVDKTVVERLADPLTHMIRNAVDHGVESREQRLAAGKPAEGTVRLSAAHRSGRVVIEVADDGAGIDRQRVRQKAVANGLISPDAQLSDSEIDNLLFLPGLSTANAISNISGRGVGMDVVKRSIQALGGRISITSRPGKGSTFSLSLPLTLAVLDGMVVSAADQTLVVPLTTIVETLMPSPGSIHSLGENAKVISIRGSFIPLIDVSFELGFCGPRNDVTDRVAILVESETGGRHALLFDAIQDQRQVVIKSLESNYGKIRGIAAATILGDGRVALILDVDAVVSRPYSESPIVNIDDRTGALAL